MSDFKKLFIYTMVGFSALSSSNTYANHEIGYYTFGQYRYFSPKFDVDTVDCGVDTYHKSAQRFFRSVPAQNINNFKNIDRVVKETISYGDWDKPYRVMIGYEFDDRRNKTSSSSYGYRNHGNNFYLLADKAVPESYWRLGGGFAAVNADSEYDNNFSHIENALMLTGYAVYNNSPEQLRWRLRMYLGYGDNDLTRYSDNLIDMVKYDSSRKNYYYGIHNSVAKTYNVGSGFYLQPYADFSIYGMREGDSNEPNGMQFKARSLALWEGDVGVYAGIKRDDKWGNQYNFRFGPYITYNFSDYQEGFYNTDEDYFKKSKTRKDYVTWKAVFNYYFDNGFGLYSDFRYYHRGNDSIAYLIGANYSF